MRKDSVLVLAAAVALLAAPAFAADPAVEELTCQADAAGEAPELLPAEAEAAPEEADLEIDGMMNPEPTPAFCPTNIRCTFFCPEFEKCSGWDCIGGWCHYYL